MMKQKKEAKKGKMFSNNNRPKHAKKSYTLSLSEEEIEKEISTIFDYCNTYVLRNIQLNLVTDGLEKPAHIVVEEKPEGILIRRA
jgi:hypothetical protein